MWRPLAARALPWCLPILVACGGEIGGGAEGALGRPGGQAGASDQLAGGIGTAAGAGAADDGAGDGVGDGTGAAARDVGRVPIHRLNNAEYDNTVRDLLGVSETPARSFIADEKAEGFDNIASALGMTAAQYEQYFLTADALVEQVWADDGLRARVLSCTPSPGDTTDAEGCAQRVVQDFGLRAYRRPLEPQELQRMLTVVRDAEALGEPADRAIAQAIKAMLASPWFLYRVELDADPTSSAAHRLDAYALASRLSYLLWSTMPDARLFELAADGALLEDAVLLQQVQRMLDDGRSARFVESFAGQWLGLRALASHQVDGEVFPAWSEPLRQAMIEEGLAYFSEFLYGPLAMDAFFTAPAGFASEELERLYAADGAPDRRRGFLGLSSFLTFSSFSYRTAPTLRGKWVMENLLCSEIAPPPAAVPPLDDAGDAPGMLASQNVRERLAAHRTDPTCASCHRLLDPIGLGLERFDAIGAYREQYDNGDVIDASGELPDGATFEGIGELSALLAADPRLLECTVEKLVTYALGRAITAADAEHLEAIRTGWEQRGLGLRALLEQVVLSDIFRMRRGEPES